MVGLPGDAAPRILNKSWSITADIEIPQKNAQGMIITHGGVVGGYGLYIQDGKPVFVYNYLSLDRYFVKGTKSLPGR
jgi:arylsulfatase